MYSEQELCDTILSLYPDIGACGIDIKVNYDKVQKAWLIQLKKETHELNHFLEQADADRCMDGTQCVALGLEVAQLKKNIRGEQF